MKEKILRQNYFKRYRTPSRMFDNISDLIGVRLECRFIDDEKKIYETLLTTFHQDVGGGYFIVPENTAVALRLRETQPVIQKNGFEIYRIDGRYRVGDFSVNFELQIKSLVNLFWGEIDHRILYKNYSYMMTENFVREMMYSIKENLFMIDKQLMGVFDHLNTSSTIGMRSTRDHLKSIISKMIHDVYVVQLKNETGIVIDFRKPTDLIVDYIFAKIEYGAEETEALYFLNLSRTLSDANQRDIRFGEYVEFKNEIRFSNSFCQQFGNGLMVQINSDFVWNMIMRIIFDLSDDDLEAVFQDFVEYEVFNLMDSVRKSLKTYEAADEEKEALADVILKKLIGFYCMEFEPELLTEANMEKLEHQISRFIRDNNDPIEIESLSNPKFYWLLSNNYEVNE